MFNTSNFILLAKCTSFSLFHLVYLTFKSFICFQHFENNILSKFCLGNWTFLYIGCHRSSYKTQVFSWFYLLSSGLSLRKRVRWGNIRNCLGALTQTSTRLHLTPWKRKKGMNRNRYRKLHRSIYLIIHSECVKTFLVPRKEKLYAL